MDKLDIKIGNLHEFCCIRVPVFLETATAAARGVPNRFLPIKSNKYEEIDNNNLILFIIQQTNIKLQNCLKNRQIIT